MSTNPNQIDDRPFLMSIDDIFVVKGRGVVVIGPVQQGSVKKGTEVEIGYLGQPIINTTITGIEMLNPPSPRRDQSGLLLRGVDVDKIKSGMLVASLGILAKNSEDT